MSTTMIIVIAAVALVVLLLVGRNSGPRVTQIDRKVERDKEDSKDA